VDELQSKFVEILQRELSQLAQLEAVLRLENEALKQRDTDAIEKNSSEKQSLIASIETLGKQRLALLQAAGKGTDKDSVLAFVNTEPKLQERWDELEAILQRCQKQNQVNGMVLETSRQQTQQILGILLGQESRKDTQLYDAKGGTSPSFVNGRSVKV
jgi:flagellar biosynthesis/type III secretory pathway chaperone